MNHKTLQFNNEFAAVKPRILERDSWTCMCHCGVHSLLMTVDHIVPRSLQGTNEKTNLITLCDICHTFWTYKPSPYKVKALRKILEKAYGYAYKDKYSKVGIT